jgi:hypothetical protein
VEASTSAAKVLIDGRLRCIASSSSRATIARTAANERSIRLDYFFGLSFEMRHWSAAICRFDRRKFS